MGHRATYVLVRDGEWRLYYSHWGASGLDVHLLDGPGSATRFVTAQREMERDAWLDDVWCEGAALVDHDARELLFFTWHLEGYVHRRAVLTVLGRTWPGWRIRWAYDGLEDVAAYVGADPGLVRSARSRADPEPPATAEPEPADPGEESALAVTVADGDGIRAYAVFEEELQDLLDRGPVVAGQLPRAALTDRLDTIPAGGLHVDTVRRRVCAWTLLYFAGTAAAGPRRWPGWEWTFWADRYEEHERAAAGALGFARPGLRPGAALLAQRLERLGERDPVGDFARLTERLAAQEGGGEIRVSPWTVAHTPTTPLPEERARLREVLAALAAE
ncbi:hypothetical protein DMB38_30260 [Streptomyces sp. WAC 06738]|uniref:hypothetical protein n=1 Tax=Streptomyces sp. WAC 06738 TaxID=2203210 RepID=UPI000F6F0D96|nr:hypothetical protein [Streptomyces sp. WAC 06738]AZM49496.1 hypothetical protein DMB38_30260 [Streptomyces sp. WAC 06738]